jgi:predicted cupin superfamily sugar epimerase
MKKSWKRVGSISRRLIPQSSFQSHHRNTDRRRDTSMPTAKEIIELLGMKAHPNEGGFYVETHRSPITLPQELLPREYSGHRSIETAIYYLLTREGCSHLHRLPGPEIYHFYLGDPVEMLLLEPEGPAQVYVLGTDLLAGMHPQFLVPTGLWQGSRVLEDGAHGFALLGTTMAPGFSFDDYEAGDREELIRLYPDQAERIRRLT